MFLSLFNTFDRYLGEMKNKNATKTIILRRYIMANSVNCRQFISVSFQKHFLKLPLTKCPGERGFWPLKIISWTPLRPALMEHVSAVLHYSCNLYVSYLDTKMYRPNIYVYYYMLSLFGVYHET